MEPSELVAVPHGRNTVTEGKLIVAKRQEDGQSEGESQEGQSGLERGSAPEQRECQEGRNVGVDQDSIVLTERGSRPPKKLLGAIKSYCILECVRPNKRLIQHVFATRDCVVVNESIAKGEYIPLLQELREIHGTCVLVKVAIWRGEESKAEEGRGMLSTARTEVFQNQKKKPEEGPNTVCVADAVQEGLEKVAEVMRSSVVDGLLLCGLQVVYQHYGASTLLEVLQQWCSDLRRAYGTKESVSAACKVEPMTTPRENALYRRFRKRGRGVRCSSCSIALDVGFIGEIAEDYLGAIQNVMSEVNGLLLTGLTMRPETGLVRYAFEYSAAFNQFLRSLEAEMQERSDLLLMALETVQSAAALDPSLSARFHRICRERNYVGWLSVRSSDLNETFEVLDEDRSPIVVLDDKEVLRFRGLFEQEETERKKDEHLQGADTQLQYSSVASAAVAAFDSTLPIALSLSKWLDSLFQLFLDQSLRKTTKGWLLCVIAAANELSKQLEISSLRRRIVECVSRATVMTIHAFDDPDFLSSQRDSEEPEGKGASPPVSSDEARESEIVEASLNTSAQGTVLAYKAACHWASVSGVRLQSLNTSARGRMEHGIRAQTQRLPSSGQKTFGGQHQPRDYAHVMRVCRDLRESELLHSLSSPRRQEVFQGGTEKNIVVVVPDPAFLECVDRIMAVMIAGEGHSNARIFDAFDMYSVRQSGKVTGVRRNRLADRLRCLLTMLQTEHPQRPQYRKVHLWQCDKAALQFVSPHDGSVREYYAASESQDGVIHIYVRRDHPNTAEAVVNQYLQISGFSNILSVMAEAVVRIHQRRVVVPTSGGAQAGQQESSQPLLCVSDRILHQIDNSSIPELFVFIQRYSKVESLILRKGGLSTRQKIACLRLAKEIVLAAEERLLDFSQTADTEVMDMYFLSRPVELPCENTNWKESKVHGEERRNSTIKHWSSLTSVDRLRNRTPPRLVQLLGLMVREAMWRPHAFYSLRSLCLILRTIGEHLSLHSSPGHLVVRQALMIYGRDGAISQLVHLIRDTNPFLVREADVHTVHVEMGGYSEADIRRLLSLSKHTCGQILFRRIRQLMRHGYDQAINLSQSEDSETDEETEEELEETRLKRPPLPSVAVLRSASSEYGDGPVSSSNPLPPPPSCPPVEPSLDPFYDISFDRALSERHFWAKFLDGTFFMLPFLISLILAMTTGVSLFSSTALTGTQQRLFGIAIMVGFIASAPVSWSIARIGSFYYYQWSYAVLQVILSRLLWCGLIVLLLEACIGFLIVLMSGLSVTDGLVFGCYFALFGAIWLFVAALFNIREGSAWTSAGGSVISLSFLACTAAVVVLVTMGVGQPLLVHFGGILVLLLALFLGTLLIVNKMATRFEGLGGTPEREILQWYHMSMNGVAVPPLFDRESCTPAEQDQAMIEWLNQNRGSPVGSLLGERAKGDGGSNDEESRESAIDQTRLLKEAKKEAIWALREARAAFAAKVLALLSFFPWKRWRKDRTVTDVVRHRASSYSREASMVEWYCRLCAKSRPVPFSSDWDELLKEAMQSMQIKSKTDTVHRMDSLWTLSRQDMIKGFFYYILLFIDRILRLFFAATPEAALSPFFLPSSTYEIAIAWAQVFFLLASGILESVVLRKEKKRQAGEASIPAVSLGFSFIEAQDRRLQLTREIYWSELRRALVVIVAAAVLGIAGLAVTLGRWMSLEEGVLYVCAVAGYIGFLWGGFNLLFYGKQQAKRGTVGMVAGCGAGLLVGGLLMGLARWFQWQDLGRVGLPSLTVSDLAVVAVMLSGWIYGFLSAPSFGSVRDFQTKKEALGAIAAMPNSLQTSGQKWLQSEVPLPPVVKWDAEDGEKEGEEDEGGVQNTERKTEEENLQGAFCPFSKEITIIARELIVNQRLVTIVVPESSLGRAVVSRFESSLDGLKKTRNQQSLLLSAFPRAEDLLRTAMEEWRGGRIRLIAVCLPVLEFLIHSSGSGSVYQERFSALALLSSPERRREERRDETRREEERRDEESLPVPDHVEPTNQVLDILVAVEPAKSTPSQARVLIEALLHEYVESSLRLPHRMAVAAEMLVQPNDFTLPERLTTELQASSDEQLVKFVRGTDLKLMSATLLGSSVDDVEFLWRRLSRPARSVLIGLAKRLHSDPGTRFLTPVGLQVHLRLSSRSFNEATREICNLFHCSASPQANDTFNAHLAQEQILSRLAILVKRSARNLLHLRHAFVGEFEDWALADSPQEGRVDHMPHLTDLVRREGLEYEEGNKREWANEIRGAAITSGVNIHRVISFFASRVRHWRRICDRVLFQGMQLFDTLGCLSVLGLTGDVRFAAEVEHALDPQNTILEGGVGWAGKLYLKGPLRLFGFLSQRASLGFVWMDLQFLRPNIHRLTKAISRGYHRSLIYEMEGEEKFLSRVAIHNPLNPETGFVERKGRGDDLLRVNVYKGKVDGAEPVSRHGRVRILVYQHVEGTGRKWRLQVLFVTQGEKIEESWHFQYLNVPNGLNEFLPLRRLTFAGHVEVDSEGLPSCPSEIVEYDSLGRESRALLFKQLPSGKKVQIQAEYETVQKDHMPRRHFYQVVVDDLEKSPQSVEGEQRDEENEFPFWRYAVVYLPSTSVVTLVGQQKKGTNIVLVKQQSYQHTKNPVCQSYYYTPDIGLIREEGGTELLGSDAFGLSQRPPASSFFEQDILGPPPPQGETVQRTILIEDLYSGNRLTTAQARVLIWQQWRGGELSAVLAQILDSWVMRKEPMLKEYFSLVDFCKTAAARQCLLSLEGSLGPVISFPEMQALCHAIRLPDLFSIGPGGSAQDLAIVNSREKWLDYEQQQSSPFMTEEVYALVQAFQGDVLGVGDHNSAAATRRIQLVERRRKGRELRTLKYDAEHPLTLLGLDSGTWPADGGGVASCRRDLVNRLPRMRWRMASEVGNPMKLVQEAYQIEKNVQSVTFIPLWGMEVGGPNDAVLSDMPCGRLAAKSWRTTPEVIRKYFVPLLVQFAQSVSSRKYEYSANSSSKEVHQALYNASALLVGFYLYFQRHDWVLTWESPETTTAWEEVWWRIVQNQIVETEDDVESPLSCELPTLSDLDTALNLMMHFLMPFSFPLSTRGAGPSVEGLAEVVHATHHGIQAALGAIARQIDGSGFVVWDHGILWRERSLALSQIPIFSLFVRNVMVMVTRLSIAVVFEHADLIVPCASMNNPDWEARLGGRGSAQETLRTYRKISPVPNGMETDRFRVRRERELSVPTAVMLSHVYDLKDVKNAIRSADVIVNQFGVRSYRLLIYGGLNKDLAYVDDCRALIANSGLTENVNLMGLGRAAEVLSQGWVFVNSSKSEGLPLALGEAGLTGLPVVCTDVGGSREMVSEKELVFGAVAPARNPRALAEAQINVLAMLGPHHGMCSGKHLGPLELEEYAPFNPFGPSLVARILDPEVKKARQRLGMAYRANVLQKFGMERYLREHEQMVWLAASRAHDRWLVLQRQQSEARLVHERRERGEEWELEDVSHMMDLQETYVQMKTVLELDESPVARRRSYLAFDPLRSRHSELARRLSIAPRPSEMGWRKGGEVGGGKVSDGGIGGGEGGGGIWSITPRSVIRRRGTHRSDRSSVSLVVPHVVFERHGVLEEGGIVGSGTQATAWKPPLGPIREEALGERRGRE